MNELEIKLIELLQNKVDFKEISISDMFNNFLNFVKATKNNGTYEMNQCHVKLIMKVLNALNIKMTSQINTEIINQYILAKKQIGNKNATINKQIGIIKRAISYNESLGLIKPKININVSKLQETQPKIKIIENNDLLRIINYTDKLIPSNKLIILLLIATGIRRTELTNIKLSNIDLEQNSIYLENTKTAKPRYIFFNEEIKKLIKLQFRFNKIYLFENKGNKIKAQQISSLTNRIKKDLNIKCLSPHKFRHTFATHLIINGANIDETANLLGHSSYNMTKRYLHINNNALKYASNHYNPLNSIKKSD